MIQAAGDLSLRQYGFRHRQSTTDMVLQVSEVVRRASDHNHFSCWMVLLVTLDVRNFSALEGDILEDVCFMYEPGTSYRYWKII